MSATFTEKARLAALVHGWPPYAEPLDCEDVKGSRSLFGESSPVPKPVLSQEEEGGGRKRSGAPGNLPPGSCILWESAENLPPVDLALRIRGEKRPTPVPRGEALPALDVPASTYLGGKCASTFTLAWKLLENGLLPAWGAVLCSCQTEGRGQLRRPWHSPRGNLYVSFRLPADPNLRGDAASLVVGGLLVRAFARLGFPLSLKWPNDLLLEESAKVGGLLLEERDGVILAGLGINLAEAPPAALMRADRATRAAVLLPHHALPDGDPANERQTHLEYGAPIAGDPPVNEANYPYQMHVPEIKSSGKEGWGSGGREKKPFSKARPT